MKQSRREFLKQGAITLILGASASGCGRGVVRRDLKSVAPPDLLTDVEIDILEHARLAPSGHNTQPWQLSILGAGKWRISVDPDRYLPAVDPDHRETILSMGAFVETLVVASRALAFDAQINVIGNSLDDVDLVEVTLTERTDGNVDQTRLEQIRSRRTIRNGLSTDVLEVEDLRTVTAPLGESWQYLPSDTGGAETIAEMTLAAYEAQVARDDAQEELAEWIRFTDEAAEKHRDGLTPESMEISGFSGWVVRNWYDAEDVTSQDFRETSVEQAQSQLKEGAGWLVLTSPSDSLEDVLNAGRKLQAMWLLARDVGLGVHPMSQALEESPWKADLLAELVITEAEIQFLLRVGYVDDYPDPVSLRRPVEWFVV